MTIAEAIKVLQLDLNDPSCVNLLDLKQAQALGIEALKRLHTLRTVHKSSCGGSLPGETRED